MENEHDFEPERWVRNRRTGIPEPVGEATLALLLEREDENGDPLYEEIDNPAVSSVGGGSWEVYLGDEEHPDGGDAWYARPVGSVGETNSLGPYKTKAGARQGVTRRYENATVQDTAPDLGADEDVAPPEPEA